MPYNGSMILIETIKFIEKHLFDEINYDELARIMLTNKFNIMRIFSASTDYTLAEYIMQTPFGSGKDYIENEQKYYRRRVRLRLFYGGKFFESI